MPGSSPEPGIGFGRAGERPAECAIAARGHCPPPPGGDRAAGQGQGQAPLHPSAPQQQEPSPTPARDELLQPLDDPGCTGGLEKFWGEHIASSPALSNGTRGPPEGPAVPRGASEPPTLLSWSFWEDFPCPCLPARHLTQHRFRTARPDDRTLAAFQRAAFPGFFLLKGIALLGPQLLLPPAPPAFSQTCRWHRGFMITSLFDWFHQPVSISLPKLFHQCRQHRAFRIGKDKHRERHLPGPRGAGPATASSLPTLGAASLPPRCQNQHHGHSRGVVSPRRGRVPTLDPHKPVPPVARSPQRPGCHR